LVTLPHHPKTFIILFVSRSMAIQAKITALLICSIMNYYKLQQPDSQCSESIRCSLTIAEKYSYFLQTTGLAWAYGIS